MDEAEGVKSLIEKWRLVGPVLERQREQDIRDTDTARDLPIFFGLTDYAVKHHPPTDTSGLVELHRWLDCDSPITSKG
ncbi:MAG: hypothetical protein AAF800_02095 [Planctomycetota bacterium]